MRLCASLLLLAFFIPSSPPVEREVFAMGTLLKITSLEPKRERAIHETEAVIQVIEEAEDQLSTWRPSSELSRLNSQPQDLPFQASSSLFELLQATASWVEQTGGAFEPTVGHPVVGFGFLEMEQKTRMIIRRKPVVVDPGGFGKGEALDRASRLAESKGFAPMILDFGGQVAITGSLPEGKTWSVSIAMPTERDTESVLGVSFRRGSLSTSGQSERPGHILDPRSNQPASDFGSVTVWHEQALVADILSTALFVMGPDEGFRWAVDHQIAACFLIQLDSGMISKKTPGFERL